MPMDGNGFTISVGGGTNAGEVGWTLVDMEGNMAMVGSVGEITTCTTEQVLHEYTFAVDPVAQELMDGEDWDLRDSDGRVLLSGDVGIVTTCSSCARAEEIEGIWGTVLDMHIMDPSGEGWQGNTITVTDCQGNILHKGTTLHGGLAESHVCIPWAVGYHIAVTGGTAANVEWTLHELDQEFNQWRHYKKSQ